MDNVVPLFRGHLADGLVHGDAGVVDQDVQLPVLVEHLADDADAVLVELMLPWWTVTPWQEWAHDARVPLP